MGRQFKNRKIYEGKTLTEDSVRILICGDSFCVPDRMFPGLHWSEKILNHSSTFKISNFAYGGSSNALISLQLLQGLQLNPDFVIFSFTNPLRYEFDKDVAAITESLTDQKIADLLYINRRYTTTCYSDNTEKIKTTDHWLATAASMNMEMIKNYMYLLMCMTTCVTQRIPFCYSIGGFDDVAHLSDSNYIKNFISDYQDRALITNLWSHRCDSLRPHFHVSDDAVQTLFANECIDHILRKKSC